MDFVLTAVSGIRCPHPLELLLAILMMLGWKPERLGCGLQTAAYKGLEANVQQFINRGVDLTSHFNDRVERTALDFAMIGCRTIAEVRGERSRLGEYKNVIDLLLKRGGRTENTKELNQLLYEIHRSWPSDSSSDD